MGAIFFFVPLPSSVTVTAEVVKLRRGGAARSTESAAKPPVAAR